MKKSIKWGVIFFSALLVVFSGNLIGNLIGDNIDIGSVLLDILLIALVVTLLISSILIWRTREKAKETQKSVDEMNEKIDNLKRIVEEDENDNGDDMK